MNQTISEKLLADAGAVTWRYNHSNDIDSIKKAIKRLRTTITQLETTLVTEGSS